MVRDLGSHALDPARGHDLRRSLLFLLVCYELHGRDKEIMAKRG